MMFRCCARALETIMLQLTHPPCNAPLNLPVTDGKNMPISSVNEVVMSA